MGPFFWGMAVGSLFTAAIASIGVPIPSEKGEKWQVALVIAWGVSVVFLLLAIGLGAVSSGGSYVFVPSTPTPLLGR